MFINKGFSLIELLIVIAIIAIIAAIAYPSYTSYMIEARRGEAQHELMKAQLKQSGWHILQPTYSSTNSDIGLPSSNDYYTFSIVSASTSTYSLRAVAKTGTTQANDIAACKSLYIDQDSNHTSDGATNNDQCW